MFGGRKEDQTGCRILVVDDHADARLCLTTILTAAGYSVTEASNGVDAFSLLLRQDFDVLLTDLLMEPMDGFGLIASVGLLPGARQRPRIVVCSTMVGDGRVAARPELQTVYRLIGKPINAAELIEAIESARRGVRKRSWPPILMAM
jgi:two-component system chemotaxis response regulator CheY